MLYHIIIILLRFTVPSQSHLQYIYLSSYDCKSILLVQMGQTTGGKEWQLGRQLLLWAGSADNFPSLILSGGRTTICSFVHEEDEVCFQSPTKWPLASQPCACFWLNCWRQTPWGQCDGTPSKSGVWACGTTQPDWHLPENARLWHSDESRVILSTCDRREGAWRRCVARAATCNILQCD